MSDIEVQTSLKIMVCNSFALLGYPPIDYPKDHHIYLDPETFSKSNTKALESLLYYTFSLLCPSNLQLFVFSWPPRTSEMKREFKEESFKLLSKLEQESRIPANSILGKSVLDSAQGDRVWTLLKVLSDCCLKQNMSVPYFQNLALYTSNPANAVRSSVYRMKKSLLIHISNYAQDFNAKVAKLQGDKEAWKDHARFLTEQHATLRGQLDDLVKAKKKIDPNSAYQEKLAALDRVPQIDMLRYIWKNIDELTRTSEERQSIDFVVEGKTCDRKIAGNVQGELEKWAKKIQELKKGVESDSRFGISLFTGQLREVISRFKKRQYEELQKILQAKKALQELMDTNC